MASYAFQSVFGPLLYANFAPAHQTTALAYWCDAVGIGIVDPIYTLVADVSVDGLPDYVPGWGQLLDPTTIPAANLPYLGQFVGVQIPPGTDELTARSLVKAEAGKNRGTLASIRAAVERSISTPWAPLTAYLAGVLVTNAGLYYKVTTNFTSGATFTTTDLLQVDPASQYQVVERFAPPGTITNTLGAQWARARGSWQHVDPSITWASYAPTADPTPYQLTVVVQPGQLTPTNNTTALNAALAANKPAGILLYVIAVATPEWFQATKTWNAVGAGVKWATLTTGDV